MRHLLRASPAGLFLLAVGRRRDDAHYSDNPGFDETIRIQLEACMSTTVEPLPHLRFEIPEAARILRISRATLYERIREGLITTQKDGRRTFITAAELQRYVIADRKFNPPPRCGSVFVERALW
jgi:excisionase family DNA binding protein